MGTVFVLFCFSVLNDLQCKGLQSGQTLMDYSSQGSRKQEYECRNTVISPPKQNIMFCKITLKIVFYIIIDIILCRRLNYTNNLSL